jgi:glycosyltransferase involved in cell wall biosynthesis
VTPNLVSCYCATYGRAHCLEESIECFLRQDYKGPKELVILNDYEDQNLIFDHPEVKIVNLPYRITPLGAKFNATVEMCSGDVLFCWEDDDIYLPKTISYGLEHMEDGIFHTGDGFFEHAAKHIITASNVFHATHTMTRELFNSVNGYPVKDQCSVDIEIMEKLGAVLGKGYSKTVPVNERQYIYRWSTVKSYHGSGWGPGIEDLSGKVENILEQQKQSGLIPSGDVVLKPKWSYEYMDFLPRE